MSVLADRIANLSPEKQALLHKKLQSRQKKVSALSRRPHLTVYPTSFAQQRLWFLDQLEPNSALYNMPGALQLTGPLDIELLRQSIERILQRHEALRANFIEVKGEPVQLINEQVSLDLPVIHLGSLPPIDQQAEIQRLAAAEAKRPFNLSQDPLFRATLLTCGAHKHILLLTVHHIAFDGWSTGIFINEISIIYEALAEGIEPELPDLPIQYADYAHWQQTYLSSSILAHQRDYWIRQLEDTPTLDLPTDYPRPPVYTADGAHHKISIPIQLADAARELARTSNTTLFNVLLTLFNVLLYRYTQQDDICVGIPTANRNRAVLERLIGFFVNTLVIRADLTGTPTFRQLLHQVHHTTVSAQSHQDIPFEMLVEKLMPDRDTSRTPLFQVMFDLQDVPMDGLCLSGIQIELLPLERGSSKFDLSLIVTDNGRFLTAEFEYSTALFTPSTIERMANHFQRLLFGAVANPDQSIAMLPLLTEREQHQLLVEWNETAVPFPQEKCLHHLFNEQAARTPNAPAVVAENGCLSFAELDQKANQLAHYLQAQGITSNSIVGLLIDRSVELIIGLLGILKAGAAYLPLDPAYPPERLAVMIEDAQPKLILANEAVSRKPFSVTRKPLANNEQQTTAPHSQFTIHNSQLIFLPPLQSTLVNYPTTLPTSTTLPEDLAYVIYTSGSTGKPKGVMIPHRGAVNLLTGLEHTIYQTLEKRPLNLSLNATICFDASVQQIVMLLRGHTLHIIPQEIRGDGPALLNYIQTHRLDVVDCVPTQLRLLLAAGLLTTSGWTPAAMLPGGEAIDTDMWQQLAAAKHIRFFNMYGPTECTVDATICPFHQYPNQPTIGRPLCNNHTYILDRHQQPVPIGVPGELYIGGAGVGLGYLNRPKLTAEKFIEIEKDELGIKQDEEEPASFLHPSSLILYKTGDLCRYLPNGTIEFLGRLDNQVKIRGFRVELGDIEAAMRQHTAVSQVVVIARGSKSAPHDLRLIAYYIPSRETPSSPAALRKALQAWLPDYMIPAYFMPLETFPLTGSRKIDRKRLPEPTDIRAALSTQFVPPRTPTEKQLTAIWQTLLDVPQVGIHDSFFELGGHSLMATQLVSRLRSDFQIDMPLRTLFQTPILADLATWIDQQTAATLTAITPLPPEAKRPLSFAQQRLWFLDHLEAEGGLYNISDAVQLTGPLDVQALTAALNQIVARHETLRTAFETNMDGEPTLRVLDALALDMHVESICHLSPAEQMETIRQTAVAAANTPFDLSRPPLMRLRLLQTAPDVHVALITMHHIIGDGWSIGVLIRELAALYAQHTGQPGPALPELPIQYGDFAQWQRARLKDETLTEQLHYWTRQLANTPDLLELPTDRPRRPNQTFRGAKRPFTLPANLTQQVNDLSRQEGATLYMTLLAAFQTLLYRYTGQDIINVGSPIANRNRREIENLIGFFVNTVVLSGELSGAPSFRKLLQRTRQVALDAFANQALPFDMVVDAVQTQRNLSHSPLFQVMFVLQNAPFQADLLPNITIRPLKIDNGTAKFDLTLMLTETDTGLSGSFEYNTHLFNPDTIDRMVGHFVQLLQQIVANPDQPITTLPLLTPAERKQVRQWNNTAVSHPLALPVHRIFEAQAEHTPDAVALYYEGSTLTYAQLNRKANQLAHYLVEQGISRCDIVGIRMARSLEMIIAMLGIHKAGGAYLPLDPTYPAERLNFMIEDAQPKFILTQESVGRYPFSIIDNYPTTNLTHPQSPADLAYIIYTSGSTGKPKGVLLHHRGLCNTAHAYIDRLQLGAGSRLLQFFSYSFDGSVGDIFPALISGTTLYLPPQDLLLSPLDLHHYMQTNRITHILMTPSMLRILPTHDLPDLRVVLAGGEQFTHEVASRWMPGRRLVNGYGPTETTVVSLFHICDNLADLPKTAVSIPIGHPSDNTNIYILDKNRQPVPVGVPGELYIGGVGVAHGYLNRPELTAERFIEITKEKGRRQKAETSSSLIPHPSSLIPHPSSLIYKTGDLVKRLPDGTVEFLGRIDHQIKLRGFRIELGEIESALTSCAGVETAVVTLHQQENTQQLAAYIVSDHDTPPSAQALHQALSATLPTYMIPTLFVPLDKMPTLPNGKINRRALPDSSSSAGEMATGSDFAPPTTNNEAILSDIWSRLLSVEQVGIHDDFFALGGDSILTIQVVSRARQAGLHLTPRQLFQFPTIAQLAAHVKTIPTVVAEQGAVTGKAPLTPIQHWFFEKSFVDPHHWNQSLMLEVAQPLDLSLLKTAASHLIQHHDALRLRFTQNGEHWQQTHAAKENAAVVQAVDLSGLPDTTQTIMLTSEANRLQANLDLESGPLVQLGYFHMGPDRPDQMLILLHHLVVDGISWRILLEDLQLVYQQLAQGKPIRLPMKTTSFKQWATGLKTFVESGDLQKEIPYWTALGEKKRPFPLSPDFITGPDENQVQHARSVTITLSAKETDALLRDVPPVYGTEINDILLTALAEAFRRMTGEHQLWVSMEGHGREDILPGVDLSRTVGWFTAVYPVYLDLLDATAPGDAIKRIKEQLHHVPKRGIGFGLLRYLHPNPAVRQQMAALAAPDLSFNYLGQLDQAITNLQFTPSHQSTGYPTSPRSHLPHQLAINGGISGGMLQFEWRYSHKLFAADTVQALAQHYLAALRMLIAHCQNPDAGGYTPSDFPEADINSEDLEALLMEIGD